MCAKWVTIFRTAALFTLTIGKLMEKVTDGGTKREKHIDVKTGDWHTNCYLPLSKL